VTQAGYNMRALEGCRSTLDGAAGPVGAIGDGFDNQRVDPAIFGQLDAAGKIASTVASFDASAKQQFHTAEDLLRSASGALDAVRSSMEHIDAANADSLRH
jgi:hypothetical protein